MWWPTVPLELWLKYSAEGDPEGGLPCDGGQKYVSRTKEEWTRMEQTLDELLKETRPLEGSSKASQSEL